MAAETEAWGAANDAVASAVGETAEQNEAIAVAAGTAHSSFEEQAVVLLQTNESWGATCRSVGQQIDEAGLQKNAAATAAMAATKEAYDAKAVELTDQAASWAASDGEAMAAAETAASQSGSAAEELRAMQVAADARQAEAAAETAALQQSTAAASGSGQSALELGQTATASLGTSHSAVLAELAAADGQCAEQAEWQATAAADRAAETAAAVEPRPALLEAVAVSQQGLSTSLAATTEELSGRADAQQASLGSALQAAADASTAHAIAHNVRSAQLAAAGATAAEGGTTASAEAAAAAAEAAAAYETTFVEEEEAAVGQFSAAAASAVAVGGSTAEFCGTTLEMEAAVEPARAQAVLEFSRELTTTDDDAVVLAALPAFVPQLPKSGPSRPVLQELPAAPPAATAAAQQLNIAAEPATTVSPSPVQLPASLDSPLARLPDFEDDENCEPTKTMAETPSKLMAPGSKLLPPGSVSKLPLKGVAKAR